MVYLKKLHMHFAFICMNAVSMLLAWTAIAVITGCGGDSPRLTGTAPQPQYTSVTLLSTSTANDELSQFDVILNSITLTSTSGSTTNLIQNPIGAEYLHWNANGATEPLLTVSVPQGSYTSAIASIGSADFICVGVNPTVGGLNTAVFGYGNTPSANVKVNMPVPITISGTSMQLMLNLLVSQSESFGTENCTMASLSNNPSVFSITPTFNLTSIPTVFSAIDSTSGINFGIYGLIDSTNATGSTTNSIDVSTPSVSAWQTTIPGQNWTIHTDTNTNYQGISDFYHLAAGMPVDVDVNILSDGSLLATRIAVYDTDTNNLSATKGPIEFVSNSQPAINIFYSSVLGSLPGVLGANSLVFDDNNATFQISGHLSNIQNLPFTVNFTAANAVAGQDVVYTLHALDLSGHYPYTSLATITLVPQTLDGMVSAIGSEGNFTTYSISLAPYDLFPSLAVQPGQTTLLTNPSQVVVYADSNTQMLNSSPVAVGKVMRFYGLVFNDSGTLRMDCAKVLDGVPE